MILTWKEIIKEVNSWNIKIENFDESNINTNSYDVRLWNQVLKYKNNTLDSKKDNEYEIINIPEEWLLLERWEFVLASTKEKFWSTKYTPLIHNKSWVARLWLFIHITADLIDTWYYGNSTLQLFATLPVKIYPGMKIWQVSFWETKWEIDIYKWKYSEWNGIISSKSHMDF